MGETTLKEKTAKGLFWGGLSNGIQQILVMAFGIYLARVLNADDYGLVGMLAIFSGIAGAIATSGFTVALTNKRDATHKDYNAVFWFSVIVGLICYIVLFLSAPLIAHFFQRSELTTLSRVIFLCFFFSGMASVPQTVLFKELKVKQQAQIDITAMILSGLVGVFLASKGFAYWALALQSFTYIVGGAILRFVISPWKPTFDFDFTPLKGLFSFSIKIFLTNIFQQISNNIFSILIGKFYNATQLGYYSQGQKWMVSGYQLIGGMINSVAQPVLVESGDSLDRQRHVFHKLLRFGAFISFPLMLGLSFVGREFILITIGEKWLPSLIFLQLFCIWGAFVFLYLLYSLLLLSRGKSNIYMNVIIITGISQLCSVILTYRLGIKGMVLAYIASYFVGIIIWQYYAHKYVQIKFANVLRDISPYLGITLISFLIAWGCLSIVNSDNVWVNFIFKIILSAFFYIILLRIFGSKILKESIGFILKRQSMNNYL